LPVAGNTRDTGERRNTCEGSHVIGPDATIQLR